MWKALPTPAGRRARWSDRVVTAFHTRLRLGVGRMEGPSRGAELASRFRASLVEECLVTEAFVCPIMAEVTRTEAIRTIVNGMGGRSQLTGELRPNLLPCFLTDGVL